MLPKKFQKNKRPCARERGLIGDGASVLFFGYMPVARGLSSSQLRASTLDLFILNNQFKFKAQFPGPDPDPRKQGVQSKLDIP